VSSVENDWFAKECLGYLFRLYPTKYGMYDNNARIMNFLWNGEDAKYDPAIDHLDTRTKLHRGEYIMSCFGGKCVRRLPLYRNTFSQFLTDCFSKSVLFV
jgi:hypothetical protein